MGIKEIFNFNKKPLFMRGLDYIKNVNLTALNTEVSMNNIDRFNDINPLNLSSLTS